MIRCRPITKRYPLPEERITQNTIRNPGTYPSRDGGLRADHRVSVSAVWARGEFGDIEDMGVAVVRGRSAAITHEGIEIFMKQESIGGG